MSESPPVSLNVPESSPGKSVPTDDCIAGDTGLEVAPADPIRLHPDDLAALRESLEPRQNFAERAKAWIKFAESALLFAVLVAVIGSLGYFVVREIRTDVLVIEAFEVPESFAKEYGLTGRAVAQMLRGEMSRISSASSTVLKRARFAGAWESLTPDISVPGTGLTLDSVMRYVRRNETRVSGTLLVEGNRGGPRLLRLHMHVSGRPDMLGDPVAPAEFKVAVEAAAVYTFRNTEDYVYASYLIDTDTALAEAELRGVLEGRYVGDRRYALNGIGYLYEKLDRDEEAIASYQRAIALDPEFAIAHYNLGNTYEKLDRDEEAIASYQRAIALDPEFVIAHNNLGFIYEKLDRDEEAIASYQRAIALDPEDAASHYNLGFIYAKLDRDEETIASYQRAIALDPEDAASHYNLGNTYEKLDRDEEAIASYQRAIALDPEYASAYNNLGFIYEKLDRDEEAEAAFKRSTALRRSVNSKRSNQQLFHPVARQGLPGGVVQP